MLRRCKPGASVRTHHILAAAIWSLVGLMLIVRGSIFLINVHKLWLLFPALAIGTLKSLFMLDKAARKNIERLAAKSDGSCLGGVYTLKMWGLVALMASMGILLRKSALSPALIGVVYGAIGWALFFSSRVLWNAAKRYAP